MSKRFVHTKNPLGVLTGRSSDKRVSFGFRYAVVF